MNAIQFVKEKGVDKARKELNKLPNSNVTHMTSDARMFIDENNPLLDEFQRSQIRDLICIKELKHLVESLDMLKRFGGIELSKEWILEYSSFPYRVELEQAIADYDSIYGGEHVQNW